VDYIIYEDTSKYGYWLKVLIPISLFFAALCGAPLISTNSEYQIVFVIIGVIIAVIPISALFWGILHRKYLIFDNRLKIVMGGPFSTTVPFDSIETAREATGEDLRAARSILFSRENAVLITKEFKDPIIIAPRNREEFLRHLNKALSEWKNKNEVGTETNKGS